MISFRSALVVAAAIRTLGATPIPNMNQENVVEDSGVWTRLLDASCQSNSTCAAELVPLRACSTTYYAKLDAGTAVVADLFTAEKCICSLPVPVCIACATSVQAANPTVNQENYTIFADSYGGVVEICAADGYAAAGGQSLSSAMSGGGASTGAGSSGAAASVSSSVVVPSASSAVVKTAPISVPAPAAVVTTAGTTSVVPAVVPVASSAKVSVAVSSATTTPGGTTSTPAAVSNAALTSSKASVTSSQIVPSSTKAASAGRNGVCGLAVGVLALLVVLF